MGTLRLASFARLACARRGFFVPGFRYQNNADNDNNNTNNELIIILLQYIVMIIMIIMIMPTAAAALVLRRRKSFDAFEPSVSKSRGAD